MRQRPRTNRFEDDPALEYEHFLAAELGMTVAQLRAEMGHDEFVRWGVYHGRQAQEQQLAAQKAKGG